MIAPRGQPSFMRVIVILAATVIVLAGIYVGSPVLVPILFALVLALIVAPIYRRLIQRRWPTWLALSIMVVGLVALWGAPRKHTLAVWLLVCIVPYYLLVAEYRQWWGEWCPPARYLATLTPLLALPVVAGCHQYPRLDRLHPDTDSALPEWRAEHVQQAAGKPGRR